MKAKIPVSSLLNSRQRKELHDMLESESQQLIKKREQLAMRHYMMLTAVTLNESHGFGEQRLKELFDCMSEIVCNHADEDEEFWTHIAQRCRQLKLNDYFDL